MSARLDITETDLGLVREILRRHLPAGVRVWVFGSRARGTARRFSDLDLAVDCGSRLELDTLLALREEFEESELPYEVDVVDSCDMDGDFRAVVEGSRLPLELDLPPVLPKA